MKQLIHRLPQLASVCLAFCSLSQASFAFDNWYPASIAPPQGLKYPCALVALPTTLEGIPDSDKQFINHVYSMILKCLQAKLVMLAELYKESAGYQNAFNHYYQESSAARQKILSEPCPKGLEEFRNEVIQAVDKQIVFFRTGVAMRQNHKSIQEVYNLPEGRAASALLQNAWGKMASRYPNWSPGVKDSIYHHLCALDLF